MSCSARDGGGVQGHGRIGVARAARPYAFGIVRS